MKEAAQGQNTKSSLNPADVRANRAEWTFMNNLDKFQSVLRLSSQSVSFLPDIFRNSTSYQHSHIFLPRFPVFWQVCVIGCCANSLFHTRASKLTSVTVRSRCLYLAAPHTAVKNTRGAMIPRRNDINLGAVVCM